MFRLFATLRLLIPAVALAAVASAHATTYDAVKDFSLAGNPNGVWSYGTLDSLAGGALTLFTDPLPTASFTGDATFPTGSVEAWNNGVPYPNQDGIFHNLISSTVSAPNSTLFIPPNVLDLGGQNQVTAVRWTAPAAGVYNVFGFFERIDTDAYPVSVRIIQDGSAVLFSADNFTMGGSTRPFTDFNLTLAAGETLDFAEGASQPKNLSTGIAVTITTDPVVTLTTPVPSVAAESGADAEFLLTLSEAQSTDTFVNFTVKGSAVNGTDYEMLKGTKKIKAGKTSKAIKVSPLGDLGGAVKKTVVLTLLPGSGYQVGTTGKVKVKITD